MGGSRKHHRLPPPGLRPPCRLLWAAASWALAAPAPGSANEGELSAQELQQIADSIAIDQAGGQAQPRLAPPAVAPPPRAPGALVQSMNPDLSLTLDVAAAAWRQPPTEAMGWGAHDPHANGFTLQQLELFAGANVDPYLRLDAMLVFASDHVDLEEAYASTLGLPLSLQLRAGKFLSRFGRLNATHPHAWAFMQQPLVLQKFMGAEGNSGIGLEASWLSPLPWYLEAVAAATTAGGGGHGASSAASFLADAPGSRMTSAKSPLYTVAIKQFFALSDHWSLLWGLSGQTGPNRYNGRSHLVGSDLMVRLRPLSSPLRRSLTLQVEAIWRRRSFLGELQREAGAFAELVASLNPLWQLGLRGEWVGDVRHDFVTGPAHDHDHDHGSEPDPDLALAALPPSAGDWPGGRRRLLAQATYFPTHFTRLRLQAVADQPAWLPQTTYGLMLGLEVAAGAHGAHSY